MKALAYTISASILLGFGVVSMAISDRNIGLPAGALLAVFGLVLLIGSHIDRPKS